MNTPTHVAAGLLVATLVARQVQRHSGTQHKWRVMAVSGSACLLGGIVSHFILDAIPHYAWIVYLSWLPAVPYRWLINEGVFALAVAAPMLYVVRRHWPYAIIGLFGALYPDIEKVAHLTFKMPESLVLFHDHSTHLSKYHGTQPLGLLIVLESLLMGVMLALIWLTVRQERNDETDET